MIIIRFQALLDKKRNFWVFFRQMQAKYADCLQDNPSKVKQETGLLFQ